MRKLIMSLLLLAIVVTVAPAQEVQGDTLTVSDRQLIYLWGTHEERGYACGFLLGEPIRDVFEQYFLDYYLQGSATAYAFLRGYFSENFEVEDKYHQEAAGIAAGMLAAGHDPWCELLGRDLDSTDILVVNAIVDYSALSRLPQVPQLPDLGCSSISSWGEATAADPLLEGDLVFTRLLDWSPHSVLHDNHLLMIHFPAEEDEQPWISFTFPGLIGALSAVNQAGVGAFLNMGNNNNGYTQESLHPVLLTVRNGIEAADYDQSGHCDTADPVAALMDELQLSGVLVHLLGSLPTEPQVIECNLEAEQSQRYQADNTVVTGDNLVATNHFRTLYAPTGCYRYNNIVSSLQSDPDITALGQWDLLGSAAGTVSNLQGVQYIPATGELLWAVSDSQQPGYQDTPAHFYLDELLDLMSVDAEPVLPGGIEMEVYPNPGNAQFHLTFNLARATTVTVELHDLLGRKVARLLDETCPAGQQEIEWQAEGFPTGLYIATLVAGEERTAIKLLLLK